MRFLWSNSTQKAWSFCKRYFFNNYLLLGKGVEGNYVDEDLLFGTMVHEVLPVMWKGVADWKGLIKRKRAELEAVFLNDPTWESDLLQEARVEKAAEWGRLFEGVCFGIKRFVLPYLQERYHLVAAEGDAVRWLDEEKKVGLIAKPDTLLYAKQRAFDEVIDDWIDPAMPGIGYLEWKTVGVAGKAWHSQWQKNPQAWTGAMTVKAALGLEIEWFMVCGLVKGVERNGRRSSPWCWIYRCQGTSRVSDKWKAGDYWWSADYTNAKGWERVSTDTYPGGIEQLVKDLPESVVADQYVLTTPDDIDWELAEEWVRNQEMSLVRDVGIYKAACGEDLKEDLKEVLFPRSLEKCNVGMHENSGKPCKYKRLCHDPDVKAEPLTFYRKRVPHHELELKEEQEK